MARIMSVEKHPMTVRGLSELLSGSDHELVGVSNDGSDVLAEVDASAAEILIVGARTGGLSGVDLLEDVRKRRPALRVILFVARMSPFERLKALALKVDGLVLKTEPLELLLECIDEVAAGRPWIDRAIVESLMTGDPAEAGGASTMEKLTPQEVQIVWLLSRGLQDREIAENLHRSEATIKTHLHNIFSRMHVANRTELVSRLFDDRMPAPVPAIPMASPKPHWGGDAPLPRRRRNAHRLRISQR